MPDAPTITIEREPMTNHRIENKQNIFQGKTKMTAFKFFERRGDAFVYAGTFTAPGWDCSDNVCASSARESIEDENQTWEAQP